MEDHAIHTASYWPGVTCVFLESDSGKRFLARSYPEGFSLHKAIATGPNCFIVSSSGGSVDGELEIWDLKNTRQYVWQRPRSPNSKEMFLWRGEIVLSADNRYAALCGGERFRNASIFVIDLVACTLTELRPNGWTGWDLRMQSVESDRQFVVSDESHQTVTQFHVDLENGCVSQKEVERQTTKPIDPDWDAPPSEEASRMAPMMPVQLEQHRMPHAFYVIDQMYQYVGRTRRVTTRLVDVECDEISGR